MKMYTYVKVLSVFLLIQSLISGINILVARQHRKLELQATCEYLHPTDRVAEQLCEAEPPWRKK